MSEAKVAKDRSNFTSREFGMTDKDFKAISEKSHELTGIQLSDHKKEMVYSRVSRLIRTLKFPDFKTYLAFLDQGDPDHLSDFVNAITTNLTSFFRESHHFEFLKSTIIPELKKANFNSRKIRIWSAGCSTGEEPYSLAITLRESFNDTNWNCKILATDLDSNVINTGKDGIYENSRFEGIDKKYKKWFLRDRASKDGRVRVKPSLQDLITFKRLNLLGDWPMKGPFDVIFCRNVVIYFNKETQRKLFDRYADMLTPNGYLFIGHSESLHRVSDRFESLGKTIYRKTH